MCLGSPPVASSGELSTVPVLVNEHLIVHGSGIVLDHHKGFVCEGFVPVVFVALQAWIACIQVDSYAKI